MRADDLISSALREEDKDHWGRGWITPKGEYHSVGPRTHNWWAREHGHGSAHELVDAGWIRKVSWLKYHARDAEEAKPLVNAHVERHHPDRPTHSDIYKVQIYDPKHHAFMKDYS